MLDSCKKICTYLATWFRRTLKRGTQTKEERLSLIQYSFYLKNYFTLD